MKRVMLPKLQTRALNPMIAVAALTGLLAIPSPAGYTDRIVHFVGEWLEERGVDFELTRRGAIRATLPGARSSPDRAGPSAR